MQQGDPYVNFPRYETEHFLLRQVRAEDAADLLACYSDPAAVARMNADNCTSGFFYRTGEEMEACIRFWLEEYAEGKYLRPAVVEKASGRAVGTLEIFGGDPGVLRVDLCSEFEHAPFLRELYALAVERFFADFPMEAMATKAEAAPERVPVLRELGFQGPKRFREYGGYFWKERV